MLSKFVSMLLLIFVIMAFDDFITVRLCDVNGQFTSFFSGKYTCEKIEKK